MALLVKVDNMTHIWPLQNIIKQKSLHSSLYRKTLSSCYYYPALTQCSNALCNMKMDLQVGWEITFAIINQLALKNRLLKMSSLDYLGENINGK